MSRSEHFISTFRNVLQQVVLSLSLGCLVIIAAIQSAQAQTFFVLHTFTGGADGGVPLAGMIIDPAGNLYGTTIKGGTGSCSYSGAPGCGTIFELKKHSSSWVFNPLYSFQGGADGEASVRPLTRGPNGTYYGTTLGGGEGVCDFEEVPGCGVVFNAGPTAQPPRTPLLQFRENVLYRFTDGTDGGGPYSTVTFDPSGNIYGTTIGGGANNHGAVFELSPRGGGTYTETAVYSFCPQYPCPDGAGPYDGLIVDAIGNLYGTTTSGGSNNYGTVFELSPSGSGWTEHVVYSFQGGSDGEAPYGSVAMDSAGNLYGNTGYGGSGGGGTVYQLTPNGSSWNFNLLYTVPHGGNALGRVTLDSSGNLYQTLQTGGAFGYGQVLELMHSGSNWTYVDLYDFTNGSDGGYPSGGVVIDSNGNLYGTADHGAASGCGGEGCGVAWEIMR